MIAFAASALLKMAYASVAASVGVAVVFSLAVLGAVRSSDARRANRSAAAAVYTALAAVAFVISTAIVVYGLTLVIHKS
jgi:hypothetical protein